MTLGNRPSPARPQTSRECLAGALVAVLLAVTSVVHAQTPPDRDTLESLLRVKIRTVQHMALNPRLIRAVRQQNAQRLSLEEIKRRDTEWRSDKALTPFKLSLQTNDSGRFLKQQVSRLTAINEAFLTDNQGANVAAFPATSDYWQGDEEKWTASFNGGEGKVFVGEVELDDSTQTYAVQISAPVIDRGDTIGVLVVGVTLTYLDSKGS